LSVGNAIYFEARILDTLSSTMYRPVEVAWLEFMVNATDE
jgi:hypothetical protein